MPKAAKATAVVAITVADESGLTCIYPKCVAAGHCGWSGTTARVTASTISVDQ